MSKIAFLLALLFFVIPHAIFGQKAEDRWLRTITQETLAIDIDRTSLTLDSGGIFRAVYRTRYENPEAIPQKPDVSYRERLDTIEFRSADQNYRVIKSSFLDDGGKLVIDLDKIEDWQSLRSDAGRKLYSAARQLAPFGTWKVHSYEYASGEPASPEDPPELRSLIGQTIGLRADALVIPGSDCAGTTFDFKTLTDRDVTQRWGISLKDLGLNGESISIMIFKCSFGKNSQIPTLVFLSSPTKANLLWNGVLFNIERPGNPFRP